MSSSKDGRTNVMGRFFKTQAATEYHAAAFLQRPAREERMEVPSILSPSPNLLHFGKVVLPHAVD
jgi:hypothetical protein